MMNGCVPASANAQVVALGDDVYHSLVAGKFPNSLCCAVRTAIVHHNQVIGEGGLLLQNTADSIADGAFSVADGDDDRSLNGKLAFREVDILECFGRQISTNGFQMGCASLLHLYLTVTIARINIVKLLLSAQSGVLFYFGIKEFIGMNGKHNPTDEKAEIIQGGKAVGYILGLCHIFLQGRSANQQ